MGREWCVHGGGGGVARAHARAHAHAHTHLHNQHTTNEAFFVFLRRWFGGCRLGGASAHRAPKLRPPCARHPLCRKQPGPQPSTTGLSLVPAGARGTPNTKRSATRHGWHAHAYNGRLEERVILWNNCNATGRLMASCGWAAEGGGGGGSGQAVGNQKRAKRGIFVSQQNTARAWAKALAEGTPLPWA